MALFPGDEGNLLDGPIRVLYTPIDTTLPTRLDDVIGVESPYTAAEDWLDFGLTIDGSEYERDMDSDSYEVEQRTTSVLDKITSVTRTLTVPLAEITPEATVIIEEGTKVAITSDTNKSAQTAVDVGSIDSLTRYRLAFIAQRDSGFDSSNNVTESDGTTKRGPFVGWLGYQAAISAEGSSMEIAKGELVGREVSFTFYPDPSITDPKKAVGRFLFETGGQTIAGE